MAPAMRKYVVARAADIPEGGRLVTSVAGREIGVFNISGKFYAVLHRCPHLGGPLCVGQVVREIYAPVPGDVRGNPANVYIACPWHNWEFDIRTGQSYWNPKGLRARPFPTGVESGQDIVDAGADGNAERVPGPYQAEVIPVAVDESYVVVTMRAPSPAETGEAAT